MLLIVLVKVGNLLWHRLSLSKSAKVCAYVSSHFSLVIPILVIHEDQEEITVSEIFTKVPETQEKKYFKRRQSHDQPWGSLQDSMLQIHLHMTYK